MAPLLRRTGLITEVPQAGNNPQLGPPPPTEHSLSLLKNICLLSLYTE